MTNLPKIVVTKAKRRFGLPPRKQWKVAPYAGNGTKLSLADTYFNIADVRNLLELLRGPVVLEIHYDTGVVRETLGVAQGWPQ